MDNKKGNSINRNSVLLFLIALAMGVIAFNFFGYLSNYFGGNLLGWGDEWGSIYGIKSEANNRNNWVDEMPIAIMIGLLVFFLVEYFGLNRLTRHAIKKEMEEEREYFVQSLAQKQHEYNRHLQTIRTMAEGCYEGQNSAYEIVSYIDELTNENDDEKKAVYLSDAFVSSFIEKKKREARNKSVELIVHAPSKKMELPFERWEFVELIGNLVDNAIDAVYKADADDKTVYVGIERLKDKYLIQTINAKPSGFDEYKSSLFRDGFSTKTGAHSGHGLTNVQKIINRHNGRLEVLTDDDTVVFKVIIEG